jgi:hypothetical protein
MEESIMYSTELIRRLPKEPTDPILFVVYNEPMVEDAKFYIRAIHGQDYLEEHITVVPFDHKIPNYRDYEIYIDPVVYTYKNSWNN